jgi:hypothetical protein
MLKYLSFVMLFASPALAQQQAAPSPTEQALGAKLMEEINANISLRVTIIQQQEKIKMLQDREAKPQTPTHQ